MILFIYLFIYLLLYLTWLHFSPTPLQSRQLAHFFLFIGASHRIAPQMFFFLPIHLLPLVHRKTPDHIQRTRTRWK